MFIFSFLLRIGHGNPFFPSHVSPVIANTTYFSCLFLPPFTFVVPSFVFWSFSHVNLYNGKYCPVWLESMET